MQAQPSRAESLPRHVNERFELPRPAIHTCHTYILAMLEYLHTCRMWFTPTSGSSLPAVRLLLPLQPETPRAAAL